MGGYSFITISKQKTKKNLYKIIIRNEKAINLVKHELKQQRMKKKI